MKTIGIHFTTVLGITAFLGVITSGWSQKIDLNGVPLDDAIKTLAGQNDLNLNFILDPGLSGFHRGAGGKMVAQPTVTYRWENKSAADALAQVLNEHGLKMVKSPASSITRITYANQPKIKVNGDLLGNDTNAVPLMVMDSAPLASALLTIATRANINVVPDPKLSQSSTLVSFRWKDITAKEALIALCENFYLVLEKDPSTGAIQIKQKK